MGSSHFVEGTFTPRRLLDAMDPLVGGRVAVIYGPAGYGKTELARTWLLSDPARDEHYASVIFFRDQETFSMAGMREAVDALKPTDDPFYVLVDNHDSLPDPTILPTMLQMAQQTPALRLIFVGRMRPAVSLSSLAMRGQLVEIGPDQLAFTREEAEELLTRKSAVDTSTLDLVMHEVQGWPAAVELLANRALSWDTLPASVATMDGYIEEEVLEGIEEDEIRFLSDLAPMAELTPPAATFMTGRTDATARLTHLASRGVPISWSARNVIHLNPALRHFLLRRAERLEPERAITQNRRSVAWLQKQGEQVDAILTAADQNGTETVYDLLTLRLLQAEVTNRQEMSALVDEVYGNLPDDFQLHVLRLARRAYEQPGQVPTTAVRALKSEMPDDISLAALARYYALCLMVLRQRGAYKDPALLQECIEFCERPDLVKLKPHDEGLLMIGYGYHLCATDRVREGLVALERSITAAHMAEMPWCFVLGSSMHAWFSSFRGGSDAVRRSADEAIATAKSQNVRSRLTVGVAYLALATLEIDLGHTAKAQEYLRIYDEELTGPLLMSADFIELFVRAEMRTQQGDSQGATYQIQQELVGERSVPTFHHAVLVAHLFDAHMALNKIDEATVALELFRRMDLVDSRSLIYVYDLRLLLARGENQRVLQLAYKYLDEHVVLLAPKAQLHILMMQGIAASSLGRNEEALAAYQRAGAVAQRLGLESPTARHTSLAAHLHQDRVDLTPAETKVLSLLATDKSLAEVADALFISPNTLKTHLRRIYKKLGVPGRPAAVERAKVLGLPLD